MTERPGSTPIDPSGQEPVVLVVDDDESMREALRSLLQSVGLRVEMYRSAAAFLQAELPTCPCCIVLDVRLPGQSGLDLQAELSREDIRIPIIFITGHADVPMSVRALKAGAVDFLVKPFRDQDMLDAVHDALERDSQRRSEEERLRPLRHCYARLSRREREVMHLVITGLLNKQIAGALDVSEDCVKLHRSQVMKKMNSRSVPDLVRKAKDLGINPRC